MIPHPVPHFPLIRRVLVVAVFLLGFSSLSAEMLTAGDPMPTISGTDQHEKPYSIEPGTRHVLISFEMGSGKRANAYLAKQGAAYLPDHKAVFVANIYGMPGIGRMFALPKMRKYPQRILLADAKGLLDNIPEEKGEITVLDIGEDGRIASIRFWSPKSGNAPF